MTERSKTRVCSRSLAGVAGLNPASGMDVCVVSKDERQYAGQAHKKPITDEAQRKHKRIKFPAGTRNLSILQATETGCVAHSASCSTGTAGYFPEDKAAGS